MANCSDSPVNISTTCGDFIRPKVDADTAYEALLEGRRPPKRPRQ